jgi:hypothetical protein
MTDVDGQPLSPEALRMIEYMRSRSQELGVDQIRERIRAAAAELEKVVEGVSETDARRRPIPGKWNIAEVVDHIAQTQIRGADELRHLLAGRRPQGPPVYEALRSGAAAWAPWAELVDGLRSANEEMVSLLTSEAPTDGPTVLTILVVLRELPDGSKASQIFPGELNWKEYAILQRLHLLDHRTQIKGLAKALAAAASTAGAQT